MGVVFGAMESNVPKNDTYFELKNKESLNIKIPHTAEKFHILFLHLGAEISDGGIQIYIFIYIYYMYI